MKGLTQYKKRNGRQNELRNQSNNFQKIWNQSQTHITTYFRRDLASGEITEITPREFSNMFISDFQIIERVAPYATKSRVLTDEMEKGARFFTQTGEFWIEKTLIEPTGQTFVMARAA